MHNKYYSKIVLFFMQELVIEMESRIRESMSSRGALVNLVHVCMCGGLLYDFTQ